MACALFTRSDGSPSCLDGDASGDSNPRMAALLAVHLVSQILDEAFIVANAAKESGQPWRNLSILKSFKTRQGETENEVSFEALKGDCDLNEGAPATAANVVATLTPQKLSARGSRSGDDYDEVDISPSILHNDNPFIGQGDEDIETQNELIKTTSMFLNNLFDMSDVEHVVICDDSEIIQSTSEPDELIAEAMNQIIESLSTANNMISLEAFPLVPNVEIVNRVDVEEFSRSDNSDYFVRESLVADINRDVAFYIDNDNTRNKCGDVNVDMFQATVVDKIEELNSIHQIEESIENVTRENDVALYENAYATLNRDYDQGSDEDGFPILQDPKGMNLQEVELMTADTSDEEPLDSIIQKEQNIKDAVPTVSGISSSRKSTLARRCRIQGARLLACFRGWWRRKTPKKRREAHSAGTVLGMCPLSPDARRRASSLLDNRLLRSPSPSRPVIWKFNTVNEILVNSNRWKEYTYEPKPEDCGEASKY